MRIFQIPTVRLTSWGFHHGFTRFSSSTECRNSVWREKSGGSGRLRTASLVPWTSTSENHAYACRFIEPLYATCTHTLSKWRSSGLSRASAESAASMARLATAPRREVGLPAFGRWGARAHPSTLFFRNSLLHHKPCQPLRARVLGNGEGLLGFRTRRRGASKWTPTKGLGQPLRPWATRRLRPPGRATEAHGDVRTPRPSPAAAAARR